MQTLSPTYSVVIKNGIPDMERRLIEQFCCKITSQKNEQYLLHFLCTRIDLSHHAYLEMDTFRLEDKTLATVRIPHHYVLMIDGSEERPSVERRSIGF